ncbi:MAG: hypothetical protein COA97_01485 [Flavobacteriales bacterium]|nr:MAG: hypothetical protein COA97_01485 [Flavobacteriales bacterium]
MKKLSFILNFLYATPKVIARLIWFTIKKKEFLFSEFRPTNIVCIDGTLNQLVWYLENPIFLSISNSSKIYFNSEEFVFKVSKLETGIPTKSGTKKLRPITFFIKKKNSCYLCKIVFTQFS